MCDKLKTMKRRSSNKNLIPWLKSFASLFANLSAAFFGLAIVTPNFLKTSLAESVVALTVDLLLGILFLLATVVSEKFLLNYER